jgi:hypothetical protein
MKSWNRRVKEKIASVMKVKQQLLFFVLLLDKGCEAKKETGVRINEAMKVGRD